MRGGRVAVLGLVLVSACAIGNRHRYDDAQIRVDQAGQGRIAVVTQDHRPYVLSAQKDPNFVGNSRGGFGNSFDVLTVSDAPLATDMTRVLVRALAARGFDAVPVLVLPGLPPETLAAQVKATGSPRAVVLTLMEWKSDTYTRTQLIYDASLRVVGPAGVIAETRVTGRDDLGGSAFNPPGYAKEAIPPAYRRKLERLINDPAIAAALR